MQHIGLHFYVGILAIVVSIIVFGSSLFSKYKKIQRNRDAGRHHLLPQLLILTMYLMGILYGTPMISYASVGMTVISLIQAMLLTIFIIKLIEVSGAKRRRRRRRQIFFCFFPLAIASIMAVGLLLLKIQNFSKRHFLAGLLFSLLTMAASLSCYYDMELAWTTETAEHLSVFWILATLVNAICWITLGLIPFDKFTLLPNAFGIIVALAQLITWARFQNSPMVIPSGSREAKKWILCRHWRRLLPRNTSQEHDLARLRDSSSSQAWIFNPLYYLELQRRTREVEDSHHERDK